jgi:ATP-dependent Clp protease ATP-binding subunit ClpC
VEVDESAYAFLVERGFSPELGARPLKRAIEQYVLAPLAAAIVEQTAPAGDQFLFLSAPGGARIDVTFVDPDAGDADRVDEPVVAVDLKLLARTGRSDERAVRFVLSEAERVADAVASFDPVKAGALAALGEPSFWEAPDRFMVLAKAEYLDRLQVATETAGRLAARLGRSMRSGGRTNATLVQLLAERLHVLDNALHGLASDDPFELYLAVVATGTSDAPGSFAGRIAEMYLAWADRRGMQVDHLVDEPGRHELAVSGLGCWSLLLPEAGLHVLEQGQDAATGNRETVRVVVAPREPAPPGDGIAPHAGARAALEATPPSKVVVRRYRTGRSPLVRDAVRRYRTGSLDRVLAGEFDLF